MTGISHLFRKRPPSRRKPVVLTCVVVVKETCETGCSLCVMTDTGVCLPVTLCEGESVKIALTEIPG